MFGKSDPNYIIPFPNTVLFTNNFCLHITGAYLGTSHVDDEKT